MPSPAFPGMFLAFAGMALLVFVSVSPPVWTQVNFLQATVNGQQTVFGVFGECLKGGACTTRSIGYTPKLMGSISTGLGSKAINRLTGALILHPIAGAFGLFAFIFGLLGIALASRTSTILMGLCASMAAILSLFIFVVDMVMFNIIKNRIHDLGYSATLGNANWLTLGAVVAFFLSTCTSFCGACGRFATGRYAGEKY